MSNYKDFVKDFPARCIDIINRFYKEAKHRDCEVTLLLMATAGSLVMPYERLSFGNSITQPNLDRSERELQIGKLKNELNKKIGDSTVLGNSIRNWRYAKPGELHDVENIIKAAENARKISIKKHISTAIKKMRHSIAHGNVMVIESPCIGQIQDLVFVSRDGQEENISVELVVLTPEDLEGFLRQWCSLLCSLPVISQQEALDILESAASY